MGSVKTPIYNFIKEYSDSGKIRLHTPGHKGQAEGIGSMAALDLTEIDGADSLFEASGIIAESEKIATSLFGSYSTFYSAGGSTLSIYAMLSTIVRTSGKKIMPPPYLIYCRYGFIPIMRRVALLAVAFQKRR